jgi:alpha-N-arabinofuranosidase
MNAHNTFQEPNAVKPAAFTDFWVEDTTTRLLLPPKSLVALESR